ncbi:AAA family ATPase [Pseudomonas sp. Mn2068]|uniref:AAA family ATPase n=1 Tax=Pseudomonas sp. Mn2068 TaxID=3395265 RepID=UPI003BCD905F
MIHSFGAKNYYSFKDGFNVSFELNSKVPASISRKKNTSYVLGIKGGNASGKTHILKAIQFLSLFCCHSFGNKPSEEIKVSSFFDNNLPSEFYIDFTSNGIRYIYELVTTRSSIIRETIYKKISRKTILLERTNNKITKSGADLPGLDLIILKSNASIIDTIPQYKLPDLAIDIENIRNCLSGMYGNVASISVMDDQVFFTYKGVNDLYSQIPKSFEFAKKIIINSDLGISDIKLVSTVGEDGKPEFIPLFYHSRDSDTDSHNKPFTFFNQSDGTKALYRRLYTYWAALESGGILVMDEFDTHYHPALLPQLLELFINPETNKNNSQFIFTSHNLEIIDLLGKYRTILVEKIKSESYCYRLDELPGDMIRNDRPISPLYREGKLGGTPKL